MDTWKQSRAGKAQREDKTMAGPDGSPSMDVSFRKTIPIFRIVDVAKAREFHVGFLGFAIIWERHFDEG